MNPLITKVNSNLVPDPTDRRQSSLTRVPKVKTAGIIGGLGPQSTSLFYEAFTQYCLDQQLPAYPRLLLNSVNSWEVIEILQEKDMDKLFAFLRKEVELIHDRVDFIVIVCNSVHAVIEPLRAISRVPIFSIYEEVCKDIAATSIQKVGILGTKTTVDNCFYQRELESYGADYAVLPVEQEAVFDQFIFEEMLHGRGAGTMKRLLLEGIQTLKEQGCQGVIMACTELPIFINQEDTEMPLFLSTQTLAHKVVEECYNHLGSIRSIADQGELSAA